MTDTSTLTQAYRCVQNAPLGCPGPIETLAAIPKAKFCLQCGFPTPLTASAEIRGTLGTYRITEFIRPQGMGRLYRATQMSNDQPVVLKEYLLPQRCFNPMEADQTRAVLLAATQAAANSAKHQEFRLLVPAEMIADAAGDRIYLVFAGERAAAPPLLEDLNARGAYTATQVRQVLRQVLQTLHFLHTQTHQTNPESAHGNLGLHSLLISDQDYVYLCDPAAWEQALMPGSQTSASPAQDLADLGLVAFSLWTGRVPDTSQPTSINPRQAQQWPQTDPSLKQLILQLMGLERPFASAAQALQAVSNLPQPSRPPAQAPPLPTAEPPSKSRRYWGLSLLALPILGGLMWYFLPRSAPTSSAETGEFKQLLPSFADVNGLLPGDYPYTSEALGTWSTVLAKQPVSDRNLQALFAQPHPEIAATFPFRSVQTEPLQQVLEAEGTVQFAIANAAPAAPPDLVQEPIAYNGLLVYVPAYKRQNLPAALQGQISLKQLRQIFTGQLTHWQQLGPQFPDLPIKAYRPLAPEASRLFEQKVLGNDPQLVAKFQTLEQRSTSDTIRAIAASGEPTATAGTISFGLLTQTWDQCKVYPLALAHPGQPPVQPLLRTTTQGSLEAISPNHNLCLDKQPLPNIDAFQTGQYPLSTPLVLAYPRDNHRPGHQSGPLFAKLLKTQDGQYLLQQTGLVPLQATPRHYPYQPVKQSDEA